MPAHLEPHTRGFTLVELIAVLVILGALAALAAPRLINLRYESRVAGLERVRVAIEANMTSAQALRLTQNASSTVTMGGKEIPVYGANAWSIPLGTPTPPGMFIALGCGDPTPVKNNWSVPCPGLPGYSVYVEDGYLGIWPTGVGANYWDVWCWITYGPEGGFQWQIGPVGAHDYRHKGMYTGYRPAEGWAGGC